MTTCVNYVLGYLGHFILSLCISFFCSLRTETFSGVRLARDFLGPGCEAVKNGSDLFLGCDKSPRLELQQFWSLGWSSRVLPIAACLFSLLKSILKTFGRCCLLVVSPLVSGMGLLGSSAEKPDGAAALSLRSEMSIRYQQ